MKIKNNILDYSFFILNSLCSFLILTTIHSSSCSLMAGVQYPQSNPQIHSLDSSDLWLL